ncbi:MAG: hypothetical protein LBV15_05880 [Planctomycetota bacterium]|jgi:hypothetical protein|nr:hypothetical protein [Planctomycetota bacterium]
MVLQVGNNSYSNIGRMFGQLNAPEAYDARKAAVAPVGEDGAEAVDRVSLSPLAPRPLPARLLEEAVDAGRTLASGGKIRPEKVERMREDRIFAAVSALAAIGLDDVQGLPKISWPGGLPAPSGEEMEAARRRLAQRLAGVEQAEDPAAAQRERAELWRKAVKWNLAGLTIGNAAPA